MHYSKFKAYYFALALTMSELHAFPPPAPAAGVVERELEKEYESKPLEPDKEIPAIQIDIPDKRLKLPDGRKIFVRQIVIKGNESFDAEEIISWVSNYLDQTLSLSKIYELCSVIDQNYAKNGYFLARAYPPPQDIKNDVLTIEVIEGKLGNIQIVGNKYYSEKFIRGYFSSLEHRPLQYNQFLKALMLLNENSDLSAGAIFEKGKKFGYADLIIQVKDARPIHLYLNGNNYGRNLTTNVRAGGRFDWGNVVMQGDMFSIAEVVGFPVDALYFTDVIYTFPLNKTGTSLEGAYLYSKFKIEELTSLHLRGESKIGTIKVNQKVMRRRLLSIDVFSYFDYKQIEDFVMGHRNAFDKLRVLTVGMLLDHYVPGQGRDYFNLRFAAGIPNFLGGLKAVDRQSSRKGGGGRFFILNGDYDRIQHLPKDYYFYFHASGQLSPNKLTLPEQIYIGGVDTVRGFPLATALGDSGYYANFELRAPPPFLANKQFFNLNKKWKDVLQWDVFLDSGGAFLHSQDSTILWGTGLGLRVNGPYTLALSVDVGFPLNHTTHERKVFTYIKLTCQPF